MLEVMELFMLITKISFLGMTPLLAASVTGHIHIVEYLIAKHDLVSRQERIDALELLGATFVDKKRDMLGSFKLWKRAMEERYGKQKTYWSICNLFKLNSNSESIYRLWIKL